MSISIFKLRIREFVDGFVLWSPAMSSNQNDFVGTLAALHFLRKRVRRELELCLIVHIEQGYPQAIILDILWSVG